MTTKVKALNTFSLYQLLNMEQRYKATNDDISILAYIRYNPKVRVLDYVIETHLDRKSNTYLTTVTHGSHFSSRFSSSRAGAAHQHFNAILSAARSQSLLK